jgi:hypothetical protein
MYDKRYTIGAGAGTEAKRKYNVKYSNEKKRLKINPYKTKIGAHILSLKIPFCQLIKDRAFFIYIGKKVVELIQHGCIVLYRE